MINIEHKDRLFCFLFGREENRRWTLNLYNAVNGSCYTESEDIEITTISDAVYMGMKNDVSFLFHSHMNVYEQQSTYNPNMPVRELMYVGRLYDKYVHTHGLNLYGSRVVRLPAPRLVTFYNGAEEREDEILRLSDAFPEGVDANQADVEVRVRMLNINHGKNRELMAACSPLAEYAWFVEEVRRNQRDMGIEAAVDRAIDAMPMDFEIRKFLVGHKAEVRNMCITEYNEAETMRMLREEAHDEGWKEGWEEGYAEGEGKLGELIGELLSKGRLSDAQKAATDKAVRKVLYEEFNIV